MDAVWAALDLEFAETSQGLPDPPWTGKAVVPRRGIVRLSLTPSFGSGTLGEVLDGLERVRQYANVDYPPVASKLSKVAEPLRNLYSMVGLEKLKSSVFNLVLFYAQDLHLLSQGGRVQGYLHTVLEGPPGTGKTEVARILGAAVTSLGILGNGRFRKVTRADLVGGYLGQTALKTREAVESCLGGVMFIDEAYSLGNPEKKDSFAKECVDTLCECLSERRHELMVIVAGYEKELQEGFFGMNPGLASRFSWRFRTSNFSPAELHLIFKQKCAAAGWTPPPQLTAEWFGAEARVFPGAGRDVENLLTKACVLHARTLFLGISERGVLSMEDLNDGYIELAASRKSPDEANATPPAGMYS